VSLESHHQFILNTMQRHDDIARNLIQALEAENARLKAEVERLTKAGDGLMKTLDEDGIHDNGDYENRFKAERALNAAKEGKQS
jgi:hypothetical protein